MKVPQFDRWFLQKNHFLPNARACGSSNRLIIKNSTGR